MRVYDLGVRLWHKEDDTQVIADDDAQVLADLDITPSQSTLTVPFYTVTRIGH